jgi:hypothetical protein
MTLLTSWATSELYGMNNSVNMMLVVVWVSSGVLLQEWVTFTF